jgi:hypothetical protein
MMGRRIVAVGTLLVALLGAPRPSNAGILEIIWEMSGPQMLGLSYGCLFPFANFKIDQCRIGPLPTIQKAYASTDHKVFFALSGAIFGSTGKNSDTQPYHWWELGMAAIEPGVAIRTYDKDGVQVHHGVGVSWERFFGQDIRPFDKFAITVTPIEVSLVPNRVAVGIKLRMYPNGFTDDEFKPGPLISRNRPFEATVGFSVSYIIPPKP